ncbi:MAG: thioredoxin [Bacilli bacterium]|nr:thioredoxin [Bacilli bacterium]
MSIQLDHKFNTGLSPQQFIDGMTKNQDKFLDWYHQFQFTNASDQQYFQSLQERSNLRCLILAADWCGDVVRNIPVVFHVLEEASIPTEVLIMEENLDVMDQFLTFGGRAIPVVIFTDESGNVLGKWGSRPERVQTYMNEFKQQNPNREAPDYQDKLVEVRKNMAEAYGQGTGYQSVIVGELRSLINSFS